MFGFIKLKNDFKTEVILCDVGASIYDIKTVDIDGEVQSILYTPSDKLEFPYDGSYFGKTLGRTAGRISHGQFKIAHRHYKVDSSDENGLHGGNGSLSFKTFSYVQSNNNDYSEVKFSCESYHLESGYPGNLKVDVIYRLYKSVNKLEIIYRGISDKTTLLNMSNHSYFNLSGNSRLDITNHELFINASKMERIERLIPREIVKCSKIYSFKEKHKIGTYLFEPEIISNTNGYDFPYIFDEVGLDRFQVCLSEHTSRRTLKIKTTYPSCVVYTCNYVGNEMMNNGLKAKPYYAVCIECSYLPNSINSDFIEDKKDLLPKGKQYEEKIELHFGVE